MYVVVVAIFFIEYTGLNIIITVFY